MVKKEDFYLNEEIKIVRVGSVFKIDRETFYLLISVLSFVFILGLVGFFGLVYLFEPDILFSPPEDIGVFLSSLEGSNIKGIVGSEDYVEDVGVIFGDVEFIEERDVSEGDNQIVVGVGSDFISAPYVDLLEGFDSIVVYSVDDVSLYVYGSGVEGFSEILEVLVSGELDGYSAVGVVDGVVEGLGV